MSANVQRWLVATIPGLFILLLGIASPQVAAAAASLWLEPAVGPCAQLNPPITITGQGLPGKLALDLVVHRSTALPTEPRSLVGKVTTDSSGQFTLQGQLWGCAPVVPDGTMFVVDVVDPTPPADGGLLPILASATFTKQAVPGLPDTGAGGGQQPAAGRWLVGPVLLLLLFVWRSIGQCWTRKA